MRIRSGGRRVGAVILTRYLIRAHAGPFLFALTALTGLLFLNAVAQRLESLAGKGLTWDVISDFLYLSLPHTIALTLPMSVLVSVLYAFSELAANNEITAMKAGGIRPQRMLLPLLGVGTIVAGVMLVFNNWVLPEANHELKLLLLDINRKSPTFSLREQVVNEIRADETGDTYWLTAARIDNTTSELFDVTIHDISRPLLHRTTYAERGYMAFNEARTDLYLTLFDGVVYETRRTEPERFHQRYFDRLILPLRGVGNQLERGQGVADRSDREMSIGMLKARTLELQSQADLNREDNYRATVTAVQQALGLEAPPPSATPWSGGASASLSRATGGDTTFVQDPVTRDVSTTTRTRASTLEGLREIGSQVRVEIHKKYTLAFACLVFVLVAAPLAAAILLGMD